MCSRAIIINHGKIVADGTAEHLMRRLPYHSMPSPCSVAAGRASRRCSQALLEFAAIAKVETVGAGNGQVAAARHGPRDGAPPPAELASLIRTRLIEVEEVTVRARQSRRRVPRRSPPRTTGRPMHELAPQHLDHRQARVQRPISRTPLATVFLIIFIALTGAFAFYVGGFFERGQADLGAVLPVPPLALPAAGAGRRHAAVGRGAQVRHHRAADDAADLAVGGDPRASSSPPGPSSAWRCC